jgi:hypothetical protein
MIRKSVSFLLVLILASSPLTTAQSGLYMKDTPTDTGVEPNPDTGPMWVTEDIWVRTAPDPGYQPYAFPEASPPWTPLAHQDPEYRDPKYSVPNYVYVRVRNRGTSASNGSERLRLYWAKASTGLSWPSQWVDYMASNCGPTKLYGAEVTKPRKNAATATAAERDAYRSAILAIGASPFTFFGGVPYWQKQQEVHSLGPANRHGTAAFLPWHREFVNRYEVLLQEFDPTVKLLYWDWTTDPENSTGGFNLDTSTFMGNSGTGTGGVSIGTPFIPALTPLAPPPDVSRSKGGNACCPTPTSASDSSVLGNTTFPTFHPFIEGTPHNYSHVYIGGNGDMSSIPTAARDPFFFLLHTNVDRLWAQWQRDPVSLARLDPATTYGTETTNVNITTALAPWNGTGTAIQPWTTAGGYIVNKVPADPSVVSAPIYDTAPLTIPVLQPGEAAVIQIPWYPPNPADFSCFGGDQGHVCLLARIETSTVPPFGMTSPETTDVYANTKNNNHIVWKNVTVVDNFPGPLRRTSILIRNVFEERIRAGLRFADTGQFGGSFFEQGHIFVDLKPELFKRWREGGSVGRGVKVADDNKQTGRIEIVSPEASIQNIPLDPHETFSVDLDFELPKEYSLRQGPFPQFDLIQTGAPGKPDAIIGGQRFVIDFSKLVLIKSSDQWRYWDRGSNLGEKWTSSDYDDSKWKLGKASFGFGGGRTTIIDAGPPGRHHITTYFRHAFEVDDPSFYRSLVLRIKRDDGAVVYLNGKEIHRVNLPRGEVGAGTLATRVVAGLEEEVFFPVKLDPRSLRRGKNVVAVEIHLHSPRSDDLTFDLELSANRADPDFPPDLAFAGLPDGALFQPGEIVPVKLDALDSDGKIKSVSLYVDGKLVGTEDEPPYTFKWPAGSKGSHRLRAEALDNDQKRSTSFRTITVVENVPPAAELIQPRDGAAFKAGEAIPVSAQASARHGKVEKVEFWVREADFFMSQNRLAATAKTPPYRALIRNLKPGHYMVWAVAIDERDASSQSMPVHVAVR